MSDVIGITSADNDGYEVYEIKVVVVRREQDQNDLAMNGIVENLREELKSTLEPDVYDGIVAEASVHIEAQETIFDMDDVDQVVSEMENPFGFFDLHKAKKMLEENNGIQER